MSGPRHESGLTRRAFILAPAAALLLPARRGAAHGDAEWIQRGPYRGDHGIHCCNEHDCARAPRDAVRRVARGWYVVGTGQLFEDGAEGLHLSIDRDIWWCRWPDGRVRCLFVLPAGV